jgi:radical SAM protein with 4Fe4S-binding SPASM domain
MGVGAITEAWSAPALAVLRESIARLPDACSECSLEPTCRGGCRGWAHYLAADWNTPGPDCARP